MKEGRGPEGPEVRLADEMLGVLAHELRRLLDDPRALPTTPRFGAALCRAEAGRLLGLAAAGDALGFLRAAARALREGTVQVNHPGHFGLFNPAPALTAVLARALSALVNVQLAVRPHAPLAAAVEDLAAGILLAPLDLGDEAAGQFTSGGSEAQRVAILCALEAGLEGFVERGLEGRRPLVYRSRAGHMSIDKALVECGLGRSALRIVDTDGRERMDVSALRAAVLRDRAAGFEPLLVVATAGTTASGALDPLPAIADLRDALNLRLHVDAAWAGAACLSPKLRPLLAGIERADSVLIDAHKWLAVPVACGFLALRDGRAFRRVFDVGRPDYLPGARGGEEDPYRNASSWSRPLRGLEVLAALADAGLEAGADDHPGGGLALRLERMSALGARLRDRLVSRGWRLLSESLLPIVCFDRADPAFDAPAVARAVWKAGGSWISDVTYEGRPALRACITNHRTTARDLDLLLEALDRTT